MFLLFLFLFCLMFLKAIIYIHIDQLTFESLSSENIDYKLTETLERLGKSKDHLCNRRNITYMHACL